MSVLIPEFQNYIRENSPTYPDRVYRVSGVVAEGDSLSDTISRQSTEGTFLSFYPITDAQPGEVACLMRIGASTSECGYVAPTGEILTKMVQALGPMGSDVPTAEFSPFGVLVDGDFNDNIPIPSRVPNLEIREPMTLTPVSETHRTGLEIRVSGRETKGATIQLTQPQTDDLRKYLAQYNPLQFNPEPNCSETPVVEPNGQTSTHNLAQ